ncbi:MAG: PAS domain S-box protein [Cyanobacteria bacterium P01_H01_bin.74]
MPTSLKKYQSLYHDAPFMSITLSPDTHTILDCNKTLINRLGYSREAILSMDIFDLYTPDCHPAARISFEGFKHTGEIVNARLKLKPISGDAINVSLNAKLVKDEAGGVLFSNLVWIDVSDLVEAEQEILSLNEQLSEKYKATETRFELAMKGSHDGFWDWNLQTNVVFYSPRFLELLGYTNPSEFPDVFDSFESHLHPEERDAVLLALQSHLEKKAPYHIELRLRTRTNNYKWFVTEGEALWDSTGKPSRMAGSISDISETKALEFTLRQQKTEQEHLFQSLPAMVWVKDCNNKILWLNEKAAQTMNVSVEAATGAQTEDLFPEIAAQYLADDLAVIRSGQPKLGIIEEYKPHNMPHGWVRTDKVPYRDEQGNITGVIVMSLDITREKNAEKELRFATHSIENMGDALFWIDLDGKIIKVNATTEDHLGYSEQALLGRTVFEIDADVGAEDWPVIRDDLLKNQYKLFESRHQKKDGAIVPVEISASLVEFDEKKYICALVRDISERKAAEFKLTQSEKRLKEILNVVNDGYWDWFLQEDFEYMSPKFWQLFGYNPAEKKHHPSEWQEMIFQDDLQRAIENFNLHVETRGKHPYAQEVRYRHKNGSVVTVYCRGLVTEWDETGTPLRMVGTHTDITLLKQTEENLKRSNEELEKFAYIASHDLQEPLRKIETFYGFIQKKTQGALDPEVQQYLERSCAAATRMRQLINDLLSYSRATRSQKLFKLIDAKQFFTAILSDLEPLRDSLNGIIEINNLHPVLYGHETQLQQAFQNIVQNALKFHKPDSSPVVSISSRSTAKNTIEILIEDNGIGFEAQYKDRIFELFQRLHSRSVYSGTGLGLAICKKIIDAHHGHITVDSVLGQGSRFTIQLPVKHTAKTKS